MQDFFHQLTVSFHVSRSIMSATKLHRASVCKSPRLQKQFSMSAFFLLLPNLEACSTYIYTWALKRVSHCSKNERRYQISYSTVSVYTSAHWIEGTELMKSQWKVDFHIERRKLSPCNGWDWMWAMFLPISSESEFVFAPSHFPFQNEGIEVSN